MSTTPKIRIGTHRGKRCFIWGSKNKKRTRLIKGDPTDQANIDQQRLELLDELRNGPQQKQKSLTLEENIRDYIRYTATQASPKATAMKEQRLRRILTEAGIERIEQITPGLIERTICEMRRLPPSPKRKKSTYPLLSEWSRSHHRRAIKGFARYLWLERRASEHLLIGLRTPRVKDMPQQRDRFHPDELQKLITSTAKSTKVVEGLPPVARSFLYALASQTGYRRGELASITPESFDLDGDPPTLRVLAAYSKNREFSIQPLSPSIVPALREWLDGMEGLLFPGLDGDSPRKTWKMIAVDMADAGIPRRTALGKRDFHALRNTFISALGDSGLSPKEIQLLARHSDIKLTITGYMMPGRFWRSGRLRSCRSCRCRRISPPPSRGLGGTRGGTKTKSGA